MKLLKIKAFDRVLKQEITTIYLNINKIISIKNTHYYDRDENQWLPITAISLVDDTSYITTEKTEDIIKRIEEMENEDENKI